jgi:hypothetical protein
MFTEFRGNFNFTLMPNLSKGEFYQFLGKRGLDEHSKDLTRRLYGAYEMKMLMNVFLRCKFLQHA